MPKQLEHSTGSVDINEPLSERNIHMFVLYVNISTYCCFQPLFDQPNFPEVTPGDADSTVVFSMKNPRGSLLQAGYPSCHPTNSGKALKELPVR